MTYAFGHLIGVWLIGKTYEFTTKKKITHYTWFFLLLGGILPDADYVLDWVFGLQTHRTFSHSIFFVIAIPLFVYLIFTVFKQKERKECAIALGAGISMHLFLDIFSTLGIPLLWPSTIYVAYNHLTFNPHIVPALESSPLVLQKALKLAIVDMGLGTLWIFYLWWKNKEF